MTMPSVSYELETVDRVINNSINKEVVTPSEDKIHQNVLLANIDPNLLKFRQIFVLDLNVMDYTHPISNEIYLLCRIEQDRRGYLRHLLELYGIGRSVGNPDYLDKGNYIFATNLQDGSKIGDYLKSLHSFDSSSHNPVIVGIDAICTDFMFLNPIDKYGSNELTVSKVDIENWVYLTLIHAAISDVQIAVTRRAPPFFGVKFSRIKQSSLYLDSGTIKFDGCLDGQESLAKLKSEFKNLHDVIVFLHNNIEIRNRVTVCTHFCDFLLSFRNIIESDLMFLPTREMIEKEKKFQTSYEIWHAVRQFMEDCCKFILGNGKVFGIPNFSSVEDPTMVAKLTKLAEATSSSSKALFQDFSKFDIS